MKSSRSSINSLNMSAISSANKSKYPDDLDESFLTQTSSNNLQIVANPQYDIQMQNRLMKNQYKDDENSHSKNFLAKVQNDLQVQTKKNSEFISARKQIRQSQIQQLQQASTNTINSLVDHACKNIETFDQEKHQKKILSQAMTSSRFINMQIRQNADADLQNAEKFKKKLQINCQIANSQLQLWEKVQLTKITVFQKKVKMQEQTFYKDLKANETKMLSDLNLIAKKRQQSQAKYKSQLQKARQKYLHDFEKINKTVKDQIEKQRLIRQNEMILKQKQDNIKIQQQNKMIELQNNEKQKKLAYQQKEKNINLKLEQATRQNQLKIQQQKFKKQIKQSQHKLKIQQIKLKMLLKDRDNQHINEQYSKMLVIYHKEMDEAISFVQNRKRRGLGYTWGNTPPQIVVKDQQRYVKPGKVWYQGK